MVALAERRGGDTMKSLRSCLNWKVVGGLGAAGLAVWLVAPNLIGSVLPILVFAACPLSMLVMMRGMQGGRRTASDEPRGVGGDQAGPASRISTLAGLRERQEAISREIATLEEEPVESPAPDGR